MQVMRLKYAKLIVALIVVANLILFYYAWKSQLWKTITTTLGTSADFTLEHGFLYVGVDRQPDAPPPPPPAQLSTNPKEKLKNAFKHIRKSITIVFRVYYLFEHDLQESIDSILNVLPQQPIVVLQDGIPYPPIVYERNLTGGETNTVHFINLAFDIEKSPKALNPLTKISTKYVLLMPDSVRISNKNLLQKILREMNNLNVAERGIGKSSKNAKGNVKLASQSLQQSARSLIPPTETVRRLIIVPFASNIKSFSSCMSMKLDLPNWTVEYAATNSSDKCDIFLQKHAILADTDVLRKMPDPFALPFPEMFYMQAKLAQLNKTVFPQAFQDGRRLFASYHNKQHRMDIRRRQFRDMYKRLQIKRIIKRTHKVNKKLNGKELITHTVNIGAQHNLLLDTQLSAANFSLPLVTEIDLIGCERTTKSCVGTVYNNQPFYVLMGKHTPPCCLDKLKTTFNHVLEEFENVGIRYWLDNLALRSAIETQQLSPDAYDIDISFNVQDLERSNAMKKSQSKPYVDNEGFYWMKATDGHYFRVQFSKPNQIGVNLLPFEVAGNEVRPNGFFGWKAKTFSAEYLHPMSTVFFLGKSIMCPNNVREYLEAKNLL